jgi:hypothetical protein
MNLADGDTGQFQGEEDDYRVNKKVYLDAWAQCLGTLLAWPEEQVYNWSMKWQHGLDGNDKGWFYHETAMHYVTPLLIPDSLSVRLDPRQLSDLDHCIEDAIRHPESCGGTIDDVKTFDWHAAKERVEGVLNDYGETLRSIQYPVVVRRLIAGIP